MIIGQCTGSFPPIIDGVTHVVQNYAHWLTQNNDTCYVITPKIPGVEYDYPYSVLAYTSFSVPLRRKYRTGIPKMDRRFCSRTGSIPFDLIHAHSPFSSGQYGMSLAKKLDIPLVATFHTKFRDDFRAAVHSDILADLMIKKVIAFFDRADEVWTVSESAIETLREYGYKGDVHVMGNASDMKPAQRIDACIDTINTAFNIPKDMPVFLFVGQQIWQKNIKMIIDALRILHQNGIMFRMFFAGEGDNRKEAMKICESYGLSQKVTFTGNIYDRETMSNLYSRSTAVLFPSLYDMSSLVIKEAAARYCPTIMVHGATTAEGIKDEFNGFLVHNTPQSLADKVKKIINDKDLCQRAGENAYKTLYRSWEDTVSMAKERYHTIVQRYALSNAKIRPRRNYARYR